MPSVDGLSEEGAEVEEGNRGRARSFGEEAMESRKAHCCRATATQAALSQRVAEELESQTIMIGLSKLSRGDRCGGMRPRPHNRTERPCRVVGGRDALARGADGAVETLAVGSSVVWGVMKGELGNTNGGGDRSATFSMSEMAESTFLET